jgi:hypothetical protein
MTLAWLLGLRQQRPQRKSQLSAPPHLCFLWLMIRWMAGQQGPLVAVESFQVFVFGLAEPLAASVLVAQMLADFALVFASGTPAQVSQARHLVLSASSF